MDPLLSPYPAARLWCAGLFLTAAPWLFGFADHSWVPYVVFGVAELGAAALTRTAPQHARTGSLAV